MKRILSIVAAGVLAGVLVLAWGWRQWTGPGPDGPGGKASVQVRIPRGMTLTAAADTLRELGLLSRPRTLTLGARLTGRDRGLRAGLYDLAFGRSPEQLLADLTRGPSVQVSVTIPEGLVARDIARTIAARFSFSAERFLIVADSLARATVIAESLAGSRETVAILDSLTGSGDAAPLDRVHHWSEGLLAPDTYLFAEGSSPAVVASVLLATQLARVAEAQSVAKPTERSPLALLSLAALVETEARQDAERGRIAAVYANRIAQGWRLEADPTVAYILDKQGKRLYFKDLKVDSPFNTYRVKGLPPGPIAAPGMASLLAAARPDADCDAFYFVSDGDDGHVFSRTVREHDAAVREFKAKRDRQRRQRSR